MNNIGFFTSLKIQDPKSVQQKAWKSVENYLHLWGGRPTVVLEKVKEGSLGIKVEGSHHAGIGDIFVSALKICSYMTIILPLIALITRTTYRSSQKFYLIQDSKIDPIKSAKKPPSQFYIEGNQRAGKNKRILIPIADLSEYHLTLTEQNLGKIFALANQYTCSTPYPIANTYKTFKGTRIHRYNHNGTHSARQVRYLEAFFDLLSKKGTAESQKFLSALSEEEKLNLKLAAYFLRAGRVDETSHLNPPADDYYTRSALIYEAYAKQLNVDSKIIEWIKMLMISSCKPKSNRDVKIDADRKNYFSYHALTFVHNMDLIRCFRHEKIENSTKVYFRRVIEKLVIGSQSLKDQYVLDLMQFTKQVCDATGVYRAYDRKPLNLPLFAKCSLNGAVCWDNVRNIAIPSWT